MYSISDCSISNNIDRIVISHLVSCFLPDLLLVEFAEELLPRAAAAIGKLCSDVRLHVRPSSVPAKAVKNIHQHQSCSPETHLTKG